MLKKIAIATALLASFSTANAYQTEVNAGYEYTDVDSANHVDNIGVNGKYYLNDVVSKGPLAEAAFLGKASNVGLGYSYANWDDSFVELGFQTVNIEGEFFIPNTNFYLAGSVNHSKLDVDTPFGGDSAEATGYSVEAGYLPVDGLLVAVGASQANYKATDLTKNGFIDTYSNLNSVYKDDAVTLRAKYVTEIGNHYVNFEGSSIFADETTYRLGADLYIDPTLSVGVTFADSTLEDTDPVYQIRAQKFFTQNIAAGLNYTGTQDANSFGINGTFRF